MSIVSIILLVFVLFLVFVIFYYVPVGLWVQAVVSLGLGRITIVDLIRMRLRKIPPRLVTDSVINSHKAGLDTITTEDLETHFLLLFAGPPFSPLDLQMGGVPPPQARLPCDQRWQPDLRGNRKNALCHDDCRNTPG